MGLLVTTDTFNGTQAIATSYYGGPADASIMGSIFISWGDAVFAGTITLEVSNLADVALASTNAKDWCPDNVATTASSATTGGVWTAKTLAVTAGQAGSAWLSLPDSSFRRYRIKVVCSAAGLLRISCAGKQ